MEKLTVIEELYIYNKLCYDLLKFCEVNWDYITGIRHHYSDPDYISVDFAITSTKVVNIDEFTKWRNKNA